MHVFEKIQLSLSKKRGPCLLDAREITSCCATLALLVAAGLFRTDSMALFLLTLTAHTIFNRYGHKKENMDTPSFPTLSGAQEKEGWGQQQEALYDTVVVSPPSLDGPILHHGLPWNCGPSPGWSLLVGVENSGQRYPAALTRWSRWPSLDCVRNRNGLRVRRGTLPSTTHKHTNHITQTC